MAWTVEFDPDEGKDLKKLDPQVQRRILDFLSTRYRVGDWRIICDIQDRRILVRVLASATDATSTGSFADFLV